ncbi:NAD-dependent epimerase/dehydratase family protein [Sulfurovum sp.]|uniref:NAD-dependent epimerase/dehydratase family protein n=1 Tax=Sulfurovum sp. TaxID=1969726 RepID=UPI003567928C
MVVKWLITGGCGFIGRNLIKNLLEEGGHFIRIIDNLSVGTKDDLAQVCQYDEKEINNLCSPSTSSLAQVELVQGDILDEQLALEVVKGFDIVVHLAANTGVGPSVEDPRFDCFANVVGTFNYLEAARINKIKRFVFASSGAPAGECEPPIHEELPPHPVSPYGASKLAGEGYCSAYFRTFGVETVCLRFSNVYGPLSKKKDSVVAKFIKRIMEGKDLEIYGDGNQTRDFIYIDDLINAVRLAASVGEIGGETFQIAAARETTVAEITQEIIKTFSEFGYSGEINVNFTEPRLGDVKRNFSDISKAKNILKWTPQVNLQDGLHKTITFFVNKNSSADV